MAPLPAHADEPPSPLENGAPSLSPSAAVPCSCLLYSSPRRAAVPDAAAISRHVLSTSERWVSSLAASASTNPFLKALSSLSEDLRRFLSVKCRIPVSEMSRQSSLSTLKFAAILPGDSVAGLVISNGLANFLNLYNTLLIVRLVLTWFPGAPPAIVSPLSTLCDPYLNIFRGLIPPLGGTLDLSPILAFLVLNAFTSTAAALPAELPESTRSSQQSSSSPWMRLNLTSTQQKWLKRMHGNQSKQEEASG